MTVRKHNDDYRFEFRPPYGTIVHGCKDLEEALGQYNRLGLRKKLTVQDLVQIDVNTYELAKVNVNEIPIES